MNRGARWKEPLAVFVLTVATFLPSLRGGFVNWDDNVNFTDNPLYRGLGWEQIRWMFTTPHSGHYIPLTWLTLSADYLIWGMNPFGYHLTNVLLHAATSVAFYFLALALLGMFAAGDAAGGGVRGCALLAALGFSVHPLRVESVAWLTERRDVLSGLWLVLCVWSYLKAARAKEGASYRRWLAAALVFYTASLFSKAVGVTLPAVLLLLDIHPLGRIGKGGAWWRGTARKIWWEKACFLLPALLAGGVLLWAQSRSEVIRTFTRYEPEVRLTKSFYGVFFYPARTFWPMGLSPLYPAPEGMEIRAIVYALLFAGGSVMLWRVRRRWPALPLAWGAYLLLQLPTLGIVQWGPHLVADRYSYVPGMVGSILGGGALLWAGRRGMLGTHEWKFLFVSVGLLMGCALDYQRIWSDSRLLWEQVLREAPRSFFAQHNLGNAMLDRGRFERSLVYFRRGLRMAPVEKRPWEHYLCGLALSGLGRREESVEQFRRAISLDPGEAHFHAQLGLELTKMGRKEEAFRHLYYVLLAEEPQGVDDRYMLGLALASLGYMEKALPHFEWVYVMRPGDPGVCRNLGLAHLLLGHREEAELFLRETLALNPKDEEIRTRLEQLLRERSSDRR
jgi:tetratricopeptide (TPR) repeat protein